MSLKISVFIIMFTLLSPGVISNVSAQEDDLLTYVENIRSLLEDAKNEYAAGNVEEAKRLAMVAYIDNYEWLEDPVEEQNEELNDELEIMLREELQSLMRNNVPSEEVNTKINEILEKMEVVAVIVPEFGPLAILILISSLASVIIVGLKNSNLKFLQN